MEPDPYRRGGDQQAEHSLDAGDQRLPSGAHNAVDDVALVGQAGQQNRPGALQNDGQGEAVLARQSFQPGGELGERCSSYWACTAGASVEPAWVREPCGCFDSSQIIPPGIARGLLVLAVQPGEVILKGRLPRQRPDIALVTVEGNEILQQDRTGPAVAQQVMLGEQETMALGCEAQQSRSNQRRLAEHETQASVIGLDVLGEPQAFVHQALRS